MQTAHGGMPATRALVASLCAVAALRVLVFAAAFPFFNNVDEPAHYDLVVKYSRAELPRRGSLFSPEAAVDILLFGSPEYLVRPSDHAEGITPAPPWRQSRETIEATLMDAVGTVTEVANHEASSPPLYYAIAGAWRWLGLQLGLGGLLLLYWIRLLDAPAAALLVWLGYCAARLVFPDRPPLRLGVPLLLAFFPQDTFYSIQSDVLSPLCFGAAFLGLLALHRSDAMAPRTAAWTGFALASTFLAKTGNTPLLIVAALFLAFEVRRRAASSRGAPSRADLVTLVLCASLPILAWCAWSVYAFGDVTGSAEKIEGLGWTPKPIGEWWSHPVFTPRGLAVFWPELMASFWRGEFTWFGGRLASPAADTFYWLSFLVSAGVALGSLLFDRSTSSGTQGTREALWLCLASTAASIAFLVVLSIAFDFGDCFYPSREHPYFTSGRLASGALIPALLLYVYGLDRALGWTGRQWPVTLLLCSVCLLMLGSEIAISRPVFSSPYNALHLWAAARPA